MMFSSKINLHEVAAVSTTKFDKSETFSFLWKIENFSRVLATEELPTTLYSPVFHGGPHSNHSWCIHLRTRDKFPDDLETYLAMFVGLSEFGDRDDYSDTEVKTHFQISLLDGSNQPLKRLRAYKAFREGCTWGFTKILSASEVLSTHNHYLTNDVLKVHVQFEIEGNLVTELSNENGAMIAPNIREKAQQRNIQFEKMFQESMFTDLIVSGPTKIFKAHKGVLAAASPVFAAMLTTDMAEKKSGRVNITDFEDVVVESMLEHIYQGDLNTTEMDKVRQLLLAADKYDLRLLKSDCELCLITNLQLTPNTAPENLLLADSANADDFKNFVVAYIKNNFEAVKQTKEFYDLLKSPRSVILHDVL